MCGLVGLYSSDFFNRHKECLSSLLYLDTWRGRDSTGVAAIRNNADTAILKSTIPGYEFVESNRLDQHLKVNDFCWIGHNRFGTVGKNIKTNAHPFEILDEDGACLLVGAHNGTLKNKHMLKDHMSFGTDSEAMFYNIADSGLEDTIGKVEGAWAITYYDHTEEELRVLRNKERPLFYAWEENKQTLIWASEMWMIRVACSRSGIKLFEDKVYSFAEDTLYRFPAPEKIRQELTMERKGGVVGKQAPAFFQQPVNQNYGKGYWRNGEWTPTGGLKQQTPVPQKAKTTCTTVQEPTTTTTKVTATTKSGTKGAKTGATQTKAKQSSSKEQSKDNVENIFSKKLYKGFGGSTLTRDELEKQLEDGCSWCETESIKVNDKFSWLGKGQPVCSKCIDGVHEETVGYQTPSKSVH